MSKWINAKDQPPEYDTPVLGWSFNADAPVIGRIVKPAGKKKAFYDDWCGTEVVISYWCLLPAPPRGYSYD